MFEAGAVLSERYRIIRAIGQGAMGTVYEAEHLGVGRHVAVKVLRPEYATHPVVLERFQREARSAAAIGNDNIIVVSDFGMHAGAPFMVMELLKGESVGSRIEKHGRMSVESAVHVMVQVLAALQAAHAAGIVHRDLKPDNVFLTDRAGVTDYVKLLDFGISKFEQGAKPGGRSLTKTGTTVGTPCYMAPEQALGRKGNDHRADIYSAGVLLYEMLTARLPIEAESAGQLMIKVVTRDEPVIPPSAHNPEVPRGIDEAVFKAISKRPAERFDDCLEFARALAPWSRTPIPTGPAMPRAVAAEAPGSPPQITPAGESSAKASSAAAPPAVTGQRGRGVLYAVLVGALGLAGVAGAYALRGRTARVAAVPSVPPRALSVDAGAPDAAAQRAVAPDFPREIDAGRPPRF